MSRPASVRILVEAGADVKELGRRLGVTTVLEWDVRHATARDVDPATGSSLG